MKYWQVTLAALVLFSSGMACGYFVGLRQKPDTPAETAAVAPSKDERPPWNRDRSMWHFVKFLEDELQISEDQKTQIEEAIRESQENMKRIWDEVRPRAGEEIVQTNEKIKSYLTEDQKVKFDQSMEEFRNRRFSRRPGGGDNREGDERRGDGGPGFRGDGQRGGPPPPGGEEGNESRWDHKREWRRDNPPPNGDGPPPSQSQPPPPAPSGN